MQKHLEKSQVSFVLELKRLTTKPGTYHRKGRKNSIKQYTYKTGVTKTRGYKGSV